MYNVKQIIEELDNKHPNAIPVFGGALWAYESVSGENVNFKEFVSYFPTVVSNARFYGWHEGVVGALRRFCRICLVDPNLIEAYLGIRFEELVSI
jgi:hypothetical protein